MKRNLFSVLGLIAVAVIAYFFLGNTEINEPVEEEAQSIEELVHDYSVGNKKSLSASITSQQLIVSDSDEGEKTYDLPEDEFFVSIAPYIDETHPCAVHNLTGCQGEMIEEEFSVYIEDMEGNEVLNEKMISQSNGFIDLWLPRDKTYQTRIEYDGKMVESEISTFENDNTCITTMQLM